MINDGLPEQFRLLQEYTEQIVLELPLYAAAGNHDYLLEPFAEEVFGYPQLEDWLLGCSARFGCPCQRDPSGAYAVLTDGIDVIGLNAATERRRFAFPNRDQLVGLRGVWNRPRPHGTSFSATRRFLITIPSA